MVASGSVPKGSRGEAVNSEQRLYESLGADLVSALACATNHVKGAHGCVSPSLALSRWHNRQYALREIRAKASAAEVKAKGVQPLADERQAAEPVGRRPELGGGLER